MNELTSEQIMKMIGSLKNKRNITKSAFNKKKARKVGKLSKASRKRNR